MPATGGRNARTGACNLTDLTRNGNAGRAASVSTNDVVDLEDEEGDGGSLDILPNKRTAPSRILDSDDDDDDGAPAAPGSNSLDIASNNCPSPAFDGLVLLTSVKKHVRHDRTCSGMSLVTRWCRLCFLA